MGAKIHKTLLIVDNGTILYHTVRGHVSQMSMGGVVDRLQQVIVKNA